MEQHNAKLHPDWEGFCWKQLGLNVGHLKSATHWPDSAARLGEISRDWLFSVYKSPTSGRKWRGTEQKRPGKLPCMAPNAGFFLFLATAYCTRAAGWGAGSIKE